MTKYLVNLTSEDVARYVRIMLQWLASFLVTQGMIKPDTSWVEPAIGVGVAVASLVWMIYSNRLNGKLTEVAKSDDVHQVLVANPAIADAIPSEKVVSSSTSVSPPKPYKFAS